MSASKVKNDTPTAAVFVAAALQQIVSPLSKRMSEIGSYLALKGDFVAQAWMIETPKVNGEIAVLRVQPIRLNRLNIVGEDGKPDLFASFLDGAMGKIPVPFAELATRNATISLYELDWLLSQHVAATEAFAVSQSLTSVESAGD